MIRYLEDFSLDFVSKGYSYRLVIWTTNVVVELFLSKVAITEHINTYNKSFHFVKSTGKSYSNTLYGGKNYCQTTLKLFLDN